MIHRIPMGIAARSGAICLGLPGLLLLAGCQSLPQPQEQPAPPVEQTEFEPAYFVSPASFESGRYTDLYDPDSYAVWVGSRLADQKLAEEEQAGQPLDMTLARDAAAVVRNFVVVELHLVSQFGDMSIALENVDLRHASAYLEMPDGRRVRPLQRVFATSLGEEQAGALKRFSRTILLIFPRRDLWFGRMQLDPSYRSVKLALEGYDSRYVFEWPEQRFGDPAVVPSEADRLRQVRMGFSELFSAVRNAARIFD